MRHTFLDRYHQGTSPIHRLDPRLKLMATLAFVLVATSTQPGAWLTFGLLAVVAFGAILVSQVPVRDALKHSTIALPFAGMVALSLPFTRGGDVLWSWHPFGWNLSITDEGAVLFVTVLLKAWLSVMVSGLLVATTPFTQLLMGMRALRLPAVLVSTISFMYRYLFVLVDEAMRLHTARQARSAGEGGSVWWRARVLGGMVGSLFLRSYERSERIYTAMLSRGFGGEVRSLARLEWRALDTQAAVAWAAALIAAVAVGYLARGV